MKLTFVHAKAALLSYFFDYTIHPKEIDTCLITACPPLTIPHHVADYACLLPHKQSRLTQSYDNTAHTLNNP